MGRASSGLLRRLAFGERVNAGSPYAWAATQGCPYRWADAIRAYDRGADAIRAYGGAGSRLWAEG